MSIAPTATVLSGPLKELVDQVVFEFVKTRGARGYNGAEYAAVQDFAIRSAVNTFVLAIVGDRVKLDVVTPSRAFGLNAHPPQVQVSISRGDFDELTGDPDIAPLRDALEEYLTVVE